ncbi:MAG: hypothetical protein WDO16_08160 [Bacteroidota bacterium]
MIFAERRPGAETLHPWTGIKIETRHFEKNKTFNRPDYSVNDQYKKVKEKWRFSSEANVISTPAADW